MASSHALHDLMDKGLEPIRVSLGDIPNYERLFFLRLQKKHSLKLNEANSRINLTK